MPEKPDSSLSVYQAQHTSQARGMLASPVGILSLIPCAAHPSLMGTDLQMGSWGSRSSSCFPYYLLQLETTAHYCLLSSTADHAW